MFSRLQVGLASRSHMSWLEPFIGKLKLACDVICVHNFSHRVIVFEWARINTTITWLENCPKPSHHMIVVSLPFQSWSLFHALWYLLGLVSKWGGRLSQGLHGVHAAARANLRFIVGSMYYSNYVSLLCVDCVCFMLPPEPTLPCQKLGPVEPGLPFPTRGRAAISYMGIWL